jgi:hypothetical protein
MKRGYSPILHTPCARFLGCHQEAQLQGLSTLPTVEEDGQGVTEDFPEDAEGEMEEVPSPGPFGMKALGPLADDGLDPAALLGQPGSPAAGGVLFPSFGGCQESQALLREGLSAFGGPVTAVAHHPTPNPLQEEVGHSQVRDVGRGDEHLGDDAGPLDTQMPPETKKGGFAVFIPTPGRLIPKEPDSIGSGRLTDIEGKTVEDRDLAVGRDPSPQKSPQSLLDPHQAGRLSHPPSPMDSGQVRKEVEPVLAKVVVDPFILVVSQKLPHQLHRQHLAILQAGGRPPGPPRLVGPKQSLQGIVDPHENAYNEVFDGHGSPPREDFPPRVAGTMLSFPPPKNAHTGYASYTSLTIQCGVSVCPASESLP